MNTPAQIQAAAGRLRAVLAESHKDEELRGLIDAREGVLARYQYVFAFERIAELAEDEFRGFLLFRNNQHWTGLARKGSALCTDMPRVRQALAILLDESKPLTSRLDELMPSGAPPFMPNMGRALLTAVLHVVHPDRYGVYNGTSEAGMKAVGAYPQFERGAAFSERYTVFNGILLQLATALEIDLWTLDALWWRVRKADGEEMPEAIEEEGIGEQQSFGLELHLHHFMLDNWSRLPLGQQWELYERDGETLGSEYDTNEIGRIDFLARHSSEPRWLVIELKRQQTSDETVGQILRYMGWVNAHLAAENEIVEGLIVARQPDAKLRYALTNTKNVGFMCYKVDFHLHEVPGLPSVQD